ncbi:hypothetical protein ATK36_0471 [Amycolatopsis sulphurea]|uniref:Uncharacterized protein n=1 Tax=Amycolatopsis sulphurea TaxID=76022 RepID=A0A2A9G2H4_9PSEU|nr:hypothetical protein ATK36_0471 [Amycolatopsis sulphurea]
MERQRRIVRRVTRPAGVRPVRAGVWKRGRYHDGSLIARVFSGGAGSDPARQRGLSTARAAGPGRYLLAAVRGIGSDQLRPQSRHVLSNRPRRIRVRTRPRQQVRGVTGAVIPSPPQPRGSKPVYRRGSRPGSSSGTPSTGTSCPTYPARDRASCTSSSCLHAARHAASPNRTSTVLSLMGTTSRRNTGAPGRPCHRPARCPGAGEKGVTGRNASGRGRRRCRSRKPPR